MSAALMSPRRASAIGALLVAVGPVSMSLYTPAMPELVEAFGAEVSTVKLTLTVYFLGFALAQLVGGPFSDAFGRRPVVVGFAALYLAGSLLAFLAPDVGWLMAARAIQGAGAAAGVAVSRAIVRDLFTGQDSVRVMNMMGIMLAVGPALSPTIGGVLLDLFGWHSLFLLMVTYGLVLIGVFSTAVPETLARRDPHAVRPAALLAGYVRLVLDVRFLRPAVVLACTIGCLYTLATILPFILIDEAGLSPTEFGAGMMVQSGSFMFGSVVLNRLLRSVDAGRLVPAGLALVGIGAALLTILSVSVDVSFLTVMIPVGVIAFGIAFIMPSMMTESLAPFPHMAGAASALAGFFQMGGGLAGSALAAMLSDPVTALAAIVPAMAAIAISAHVLLPRLPAPTPHPFDKLLEPPAPAE
jgi:DHA1 family bicyclomycin/chloramphenicol resistance-like MFS transporter